MAKIIEPGPVGGIVLEPAAVFIEACKAKLLQPPPEPLAYLSMNLPETGPSEAPLR